MQFTQIIEKKTRCRDENATIKIRNVDCNEFKIRISIPKELVPETCKAIQFGFIENGLGVCWSKKGYSLQTNPKSNILHVVMSIKGSEAENLSETIRNSSHYAFKIKGDVVKDGIEFLFKNTKTVSD